MSYYVTGRRQYYRGKWPGDSVADCIRTVSLYPTGRRVHERSWAIITHLTLETAVITPGDSPLTPTESGLARVGLSLPSMKDGDTQGWVTPCSACPRVSAVS